MRPVVFLAGALTLACAGGGKNNCGEGTREVDGECVADDTDRPPRDDTGTSDDTTTDPAVDPRVLTFVADTEVFFVDGRVTFELIATDPQGILIGRSLETPAGESFGTMASTAEEGVYWIEVDWDDVLAGETIPDWEARTS